MAKQYVPGLTKDLMKKGKHFILIRNPLDVLPSFDKVIPSSLMELGLADLVSIYSELCDLGKPPPIIDAADLQQDPEVVDLSKHMVFFHCKKCGYDWTLLMDTHSRCLC
ncbi:Branched-chain-amino-acid aminotransferase-like protein 1 [Vitis vinifera]|uniref:Branched-chain-amino-acid aminotransferase-like protein 1 n=1 Tax=Vitis vinifera TaxID=29760 RepID=A0A438KCL5_VITVI|nr:Branched-chain-amino-acid aminotransferase-like protein 1 [Vitis vinifera]